MSAAGMVPDASSISKENSTVTALGDTAVVPVNLNSFQMPASAYATAFGNNSDVISVNDPLALANFLPRPAPSEVVEVQKTPPWAYVALGIAALLLIKKKGIL